MPQLSAAEKDTLSPSRSDYLRSVSLLALIAAVFLVYNRQAYGSFFFDDAFDHLGWTTTVNIRTFINGLLTWRFLPNNFRPVGHYLYRFMYQVAGYYFPAWIAALHLLHLVCVGLLWLILRRLKVPVYAAAAGLLVFALNMSAFYVYWRPMFHFDLLCCLFTLLCLYAYMRGNLIVSLLSFWLAYKAKEIGVVIPAILLVYEWWFGGKRWWRVVPFAVISASFTLQAFLANRKTDNPYTLRVTPAVVWTCVKFYANHALLFPFLGFLLPGLALLKRDKRVALGLWIALCTIGPMFLLPFRLYDAYLYIPAAGLAIAFAVVLEGRPKWVLAVFAAVWMAANGYVLSLKAPHELELARHNRDYFEAVSELARQHPEIQVVTFRNAPPEMAEWGVEGVFHLAFHNPGLRVYWAEAPEAAAAEKENNAAITVWDFEHDKLLSRIHKSAVAVPEVVDFASVSAAEALGDGWYKPEAGFCWTQRKAFAKLGLPESMRQFYVKLNIVADQIPNHGAVTLSASVGGVPLDARTFTHDGGREEVWPIDAPTAAKMAGNATNGVVTVELSVNPPFRPSNGDMRVLGLAVKEFGFR